MKLKNIIIFIISIIFLFFYTTSIIIPAVNSYNYVCEPQKLKGKNYTVLGTTSYTENQTTKKAENITIKINPQIQINSDLYNQVFKHEYCHKIQSERGYPSQSCEDKIQKILTEMECYTAEKYPNWLYEVFY